MQVDVVVAGADRAELRGRLLAVFAHVRLAPRIAIVEQFVLDRSLLVRPMPNEMTLRDVVEDRPERVPRSRSSRASSRTAMLPQPMSKPTPEMQICSS